MRRPAANAARCALGLALALSIRAAEAPRSDATLKTVAAVRAVGEWDLRQAHPLHLEGTVTMVDNDRRLVVVQDESGAIALRLEAPNAAIATGRKFAIDAADPLFDTTPEINAAVRHAAARTAKIAARLALFIVPPSSYDGP